MRTPEIRPGIRRLFRLAVGRHTQDEADDEIRLHLQLRTDQLMREGLSPADARAEAERRFGSIDEERARFEKDDRIGIANRGQHHALGILRRDR